MDNNFIQNACVSIFFCVLDCLMRLLSFVILFILLLSACGTKGPLILPQEQEGIVLQLSQNGESSL